jgi:hypothetical protein
MPVSHLASKAAKNKAPCGALDSNLVITSIFDQSLDNLVTSETNQVSISDQL